MRRSMRATLAACAATLALVLLAGAASANRSLLIVPEEELRAVSESLTLDGESLEVICSATLKGTLATSTIAKTAGTRIAQFNEGRTAGCRESGGGAASATFLINGAERSYAIKYESFAGTLPNITAMLFRVERARVQTSVLGGLARCLYEGEFGMSAAFPPEEVEGRRFNRATLLANSARLIEGGGLCPRTGELKGTVRLTPEHWLILNSTAGRAEPPTVRFEGRAVNRTVSLVASPGQTVRITAIQKVPAERAAQYTIERDDCTGQEIIDGQPRNRCDVEIRANAGAMRANLMWFEGGVPKGIAALVP